MGGRGLLRWWRGILKALWMWNMLRFGVVGRVLIFVGYITRGLETSPSGNGW